MKDYKNYIFDLYGTLVDIHTEEEDPVVWKKLALFYGYYDANYAPEELKERYHALIENREAARKDGREEALQKKEAAVDGSEGIGCYLKKVGFFQVI